MPRTRIPIASAELPILPFLAPRVFADSPISRSHDRHGKPRRIQQEKEELDRNRERLRAGHIESTTNHASRGKTTCPRPPHNGQNAAGGLLKAARAQWRLSASTMIPNAADIRYTDIFAFARRFIRSYRTDGFPRKVTSRTPGPQELQELSAKDARRIAMIRQRRCIPKIRIRITRSVAPSETKVGSRKAPGVDTDRKPSILNQRGPKLMALRVEALALEKRRLRTCVDYQLDVSVESLMKNGQYRSLRRRILNLEHWDQVHWEIRSRVSLIQAFAALDRRLYATIGRHTRKVILKHDPRYARWSNSLFQGTTTELGLQKVWDRWRVISDATSEPIYRGLLVYLLDRKAARAMQFIYVLAREGMGNGQKRAVLADALGHLSKMHAEGIYDAKQWWGVDHEASKRSFVADFVHIFLQALCHHQEICSQDLLYNLAMIADVEDLKNLWACLIRHRVFMGFDTILHYANTFAKAGEIPSALGCLDQLRWKIKDTQAWEKVSERQRLRWTCALILRKSMSKGQDYHETPLIVAAIVKLGIKLDILLYNVVMHNAMEARDYSTAFKVYNALEENGIKADKATYSILLHGCTVQDNPAMFTQFAQHCADVAEELRNRWLATDYLYYVYICSQNDSNKGEAATRLQQAYLRFFPARSMELLLQNRVRMAVINTPGVLSNEMKFDPPPVALYIMLQSRIQEAPAGTSVNTHAIANLDQLYQGFKVLLKRNSEPSLTKLAKTPIIWNAFLLAFCKNQQFASASQLLKDMTTASTPPNIYSWNIFMQAFFKTGQVQAAERVFEIMRSRGVDPDQFTYGVLLRGYAKAQHIDRIGEIMQHVDSEAEMQPDLLRMLAHVEARNKLMATLEKSRVNKELSAREKSKAKAEGEKKKWADRWVMSDPLQSASLTVSSPDSDEDINSIPGILTAEEADELNRAWTEAEMASSPETPEEPLDPKA
jgi:pentatricopeptide repeat protein